MPTMCGYVDDVAINIVDVTTHGGHRPPSSFIVALIIYR